MKHRGCWSLTILRSFMCQSEIITQDCDRRFNITKYYNRSSKCWNSFSLLSFKFHKVVNSSLNRTLISHSNVRANSSTPLSLTSWVTKYMQRVLFEKLKACQLVKKFPTFYGTQKFITAFKRAPHLSLSWATSIQSITSHPMSWRSILILSSHLHLGLQSVLFPSGFPTKTIYMLKECHPRCACRTYICWR